MASKGVCEEVLRPAEGAGIHEHGFVQAPAALAEHSAACSRERDAGALDERHRLAAADADLEARSQAREGEDLQQLGGRKRRTVAVIGAVHGVQHAHRRLEQARVGEVALAHAGEQLRYGRGGRRGLEVAAQGVMGRDEPRLLQNVETSARRAQGRR